MTDDTGDNNTSLLRKYFRSAIELHGPSVPNVQLARSIIKKTFDVLRNIMIVGVLLYLAKISESRVLLYLAYATMGLFPAYVATYWEERTFAPLYFMQDGWLKSVLEMAIVATLLAAVYLSCAIGLTYLINQIADGYMNARSQ